jgi:hypothetical protein
MTGRISIERDRQSSLRHVRANEFTDEVVAMRGQKEHHGNSYAEQTALGEHIRAESGDGLNF